MAVIFASKAFAQATSSETQAMSVVAHKGLREHREHKELKAHRVHRALQARARKVPRVPRVHKERRAPKARRARRERRERQARRAIPERKVMPEPKVHREHREPKVHKALRELKERKELRAHRAQLGRAPTIFRKPTMKLARWTSKSRCLSRIHCVSVPLTTLQMYFFCFLETIAVLRLSRL
jgi:hypothetical protein